MIFAVLLATFRDFIRRVFLCRAQEQMRRVDAWLVIAAVTNTEVARNRPNPLLKGDAVRPAVSPRLIRADLAVSINTRALPLPATRLSHSNRP